MKLSQQAYKELRIMFLSFGFFTIILEYNNNKVDKDFKKVFVGVKNIVQKYMKKYGNKIINEVNEASQSVAKDFTVDMALASVSCIAMYYEMVGKPIFSPMSYKKIIEVQDAHLEQDYEVEKNTLDYCEILVKKLLER